VHNLLRYLSLDQSGSPNNNQLTNRQNNFILRAMNRSIVCFECWDLYSWNLNQSWCLANSVKLYANYASMKILTQWKDTHETQHAALHNVFLCFKLVIWNTHCAAHFCIALLLSLVLDYLVHSECRASQQLHWMFSSSTAILTVCAEHWNAEILELQWAFWSRALRKLVSDTNQPLPCHFFHSLFDHVCHDAWSHTKSLWHHFVH